jgi:cytidyltransferase-like protein
MRIFRRVEEITAKLPNAVVTIGNFDGVHLGHREIFRQVKREAAILGGVSLVITFAPHPIKMLGLKKEFRLVNTSAEKELLLEASGIDYLLTIPFTAEFAAISAERFVRDILVGRIGVRKLIIGYDYAFGKNRAPPPGGGAGLHGGSARTHCLERARLQQHGRAADDRRRGRAGGSPAHWAPFLRGGARGPRPAAGPRISRPTRN